MQTIRKTSENKKKEKPKDDVPLAPKKEEKNKKSLYTVSTPRNFTPKTTTADIYGQRNTLQSARTPRKAISTNVPKTNASSKPLMKNLLKSSPSSVNQLSTVSTSRQEKKNKTPKVEAKPSYSAVKETPRKKLPVSNITVNSPIVKRKLNLDLDDKETELNEAPRRERNKTRTLNDNEIKALIPEVDNNAQMLNLTRKLTANPKSFYVDLEEDKAKPQRHKSSDEEISYEDDFESYESDFESYHSESKHSDESEHHGTGDEEELSNHDTNAGDGDEAVSNSKEIKDEERMLDSGNFDLRDSQRSANKMKPSVMDFILEKSEDLGDKKTSLTDEGFQDMSSSSAVSSMKTVHVDVTERPLFIDFTKSRKNKQKRRIYERVKQRAKDLLSMITLHEMSYTLFEMKPISYDLFMATFGRSNYIQTGVQTYDDGVSQGIQTEEIIFEHKWTQNPIEFSNSDIYLKNDSVKRKHSSTEDYLTKFTDLLNEKTIVDVNNKINDDLNYKRNPLRVYLEQKDGVGSGEMLPYENYKLKLNNNEYNPNRLKRFLKKFESRISNILTKNNGLSECSDFIKSSRFPFSKGYFSLEPKNISDPKMSFLKLSKITKMFISETRSSLLMTVHKNVDKIGEKRCALCLWDVSVARLDPIKVLVAIDNVTLGKFRGSLDGFFVAALEDGSIHLWDLSEEPTWRAARSEAKKEELVNVKSEILTEFEKDLQNCNVVLAEDLQNALQACAYTTSAGNLRSNDVTDAVVALEVVGDTWKNEDGCQRVVGQVISLQRLGLLTIWLVLQEKTNTSQHDIGKAFWSKVKLEKSHTISLLDHYDIPQLTLSHDDFNLSAAKKRMMKRKSERSLIKQFSRSNVDSQFEFDRPVSAARKKRVLPSENKLHHWENVIVCNDLKVMRLDNVDKYLIAKNYGEVVCCSKIIGTMNVRKFSVANDTSSVTCLRVSPHNLPYFLAATDTGTVNLCSIIENRVLLTLDTRNIPEPQDEYKCQSDHKGRFVSTVMVRSPGHDLNSRSIADQVPITTVLWSRVNPCYIFTLLKDGSVVAWDLTHSDIYAKCVSEKATAGCCSVDTVLALLTPEGEVQVHRLDNEQRTKQYLQIFEKYIALL